MIITRAPLRISFFGGGTDYPVWYRENKGAVLASTINKYCYITCRPLPPFFEHKSRILYSRIELVNSVEEIQHPAVRAALQSLNIQEGVEIHHDSDLPARTGLGSSSTFVVALLHALNGMRGRMVSKMELARDAIRLEQDILRETVGAQDQVMASYGGLNRLDFAEDGTFIVTPVVLTRDRLEALESYCMLIFTGFTRTASEIAAEQVRSTHNRRSELTQMYHMVEEGTEILRNGRDLVEFGRLLHEGWLLKRSLSRKVSTPQLDALYDAGREGGAIGGKILGAGGGGFMLLFAHPEDHPGIRSRLSKLLHVPFRFENSGSQIIHYSPLEQELRSGGEMKEKVASR